MNWGKFARLVASNPVIACCVDNHVGPPLLRSGGKHPIFTLMTWVEQQVEYIAPRPWETLDMSVGNVEGDEARAKYAIHFHIGGEERACTRIRYTDTDENPQRSVAETMRSLVEWYGRYWAKQKDRPLVIDAVVRESVCWKGDKRYGKEAISIWLAPEGYQPTI